MDERKLLTKTDHAGSSVEAAALAERPRGGVLYPFGAAVVLLGGMPTASAWLPADEIERACAELHGEVAEAEAGGRTETDGADAAAQSGGDDDAAASTQRLVCTAYLQGFLAGIADKEDTLRDGLPFATDEESFTDRALRTRIGARAMTELVERVMRPEFCIGDDVTVGQLLAQVETYFEGRAVSAASRYEVLHDALVAAFPCNPR